MKPHEKAFYLLENLKEARVKYAQTLELQLEVVRNGDVNIMKRLLHTPTLEQDKQDLVIAIAIHKAYWEALE